MTTTPEILRAIADRHDDVSTVLWIDEDRGGRPVRLSDVLRDEAARIEQETPPGDTITIPVPTFGTETDRAAQHLVDAAWKLRNGYTPGGSTVTGAIARLCDDAARAINPAARTTYEGRYPAAFDGVEVDDITELTYEQRQALPARFHLPVFMDLTTPSIWICKVCWDEGLYVQWPCGPAERGGVEVARAAGLEFTS